MITKVNYKPHSYEISPGKWIPSGIIVHTDAASIVELKKTYENFIKNSKKEADDFFLAESEKEYKELTNS